MATPKTVQGQLQSPSGQGGPGRVSIRLSQSCVIPGTSEVMGQTVEAIADQSTGNWSALLYANNDLSPTGTYYTVSEYLLGGGPPYIYQIVVPQSAGPFQASSIQTGTPPSASPQVGHLSALTVDGLTLTGNLQTQGSPTYDVKAYGAKGDGVTNDTTAIQNAINAAGSSASKGQVFLPPGTYMCGPLNMATGVALWGSGLGSVLKMIANGPNDNLLKFQSVSDCVGGNFVLDGNKANQTQTQYGFYAGSCQRIRFQNVWTQNWRGVGLHVYNNDDSSFVGCHSTANAYHGFEVEQCRYCSFVSCYGYSNTLHGVLVSPGEVSGTGSFGNKFTGCHYHDNSQYGIGFNAANGDVSAWLNEANEFSNCSAYNNAQYGVQVYKQDKQIFNNLYVRNNGFFGIYLFQSAFNQFSNVFLHNNSQATNGGYDEIFSEGASGGHAASNNLWLGVTVIIDGATKARWAINEGTNNDGPNTYQHVAVPNAGTSGKLNILNAGSILPLNAGTWQVYGGNAIGGAAAGIDNAFNILRLFSNLATSDIQVVSATGSTHFYNNGTEYLTIDASGNVTIRNASLATTATNGFLYIPTCAGQPTGVPTGKSGLVPMVYDTTNHKFWIYDTAASAWRGVALA